MQAAFDLVAAALFKGLQPLIAERGWPGHAPFDDDAMLGAELATCWSKGA